MLIKGFEQKSQIDKHLDNALAQTHEEGSASITTPQTLTTTGFFHKGFFIQALSPEGDKWQAFAKDIYDPRTTLESQWFRDSNSAIQEVMKYVDIYTKRLV